MLNHTLRRVMLRKPKTAAAPAELETVAAVTTGQTATAPELEIAPTDPIVAVLPERARRGRARPARARLARARRRCARRGSRWSCRSSRNGELIGLLNVGPRLSDQDYSPDDRRLLESLAAQAAPAVRVGQLVREQEVEMRARERLEQELAGRPADPAELPAQGAARAGRLAGGGLLPAGAHRRRRLLRLHRAARRPDRPRHRRRHRQGRPGGDGDGGDAERAARQRASGCSSPAPCSQRVNDDLCPDIPREHVRHLLLRRARSRHRPCCATPTPATTCRSSAARRRGLGAAGDRHAARSDARDELRGARGDARARRERPALQRRPGRGARRRAARCSAPPRVRERLATGSVADAADRRPARPARPLHRRRGRAGGRHHPRRSGRTGPAARRAGTRAGERDGAELDFSLPSAAGQRARGDAAGRRGGRGRRRSPRPGSSG